MAIAIGSIVSPKRVGNGGGVLLAPQGPTFGIVDAGSGPWDVLWGSDGRLQDGVAATSLDEIVPATGGSASTKFIGQRVKRSTPDYQDGYGLFTCLVVYNRNGVDTALLQSLTGPGFLEWAVADLAIVP